MNTYVKKWLSEYYDVTLADIDDILKEETATSYLLVWAIFEQDIFNGFMKKDKIKTVSQRFKKYYSSLNIDMLAKKFYLRYQNSTNYKHLIHKDDNCYFKAIIAKPYPEISPSEKLELMFFVVYRYRNNIFHGNKKVNAWKNYTEQIRDCISFITQIIDLNKSKSIIKKIQ